MQFSSLLQQAKKKRAENKMNNFKVRVISKTEIGNEKTSTLLARSHSIAI